MAYLKASPVRHRLFGVNVGGQFGTELIVTGKPRPLAALFRPAIQIAANLGWSPRRKGEPNATVN